jgi:hypothetical protein
MSAVSTEVGLGVVMHVGCGFKFDFVHPSMIAVLVIQHDCWTPIEPYFMRQNDVVRSIVI